MRTALTAFILAASAAVGSSASAQPPIRTPAEQTDFGRYTQNRDIWAFLETVSGASRRVRVLEVGRTAEAPDFPPAAVYLAVISENGTASPQELDRKKPTILVMAAQHGNEQSGKEAALALIRDLAVGDLQPLLKRVNVLVMPQTNPYGNFVDRRANEQGLDLNRDHVKLESPETRAIHAVFAQWTPEVTLDVHEKGDDYYRVTTGCVTNPNIAAAIRRFSMDTVFKDTEALVEANGSTWHEYLVTEAMGSQGAAGAPAQADESRRETLTRPSTTDLNDGRNSLGIYETISFIQEGASRHDIPTLQDRTADQYLGIKALVQSTARNAAQVLQIVKSARAALLARAQAPAPNDLVYLRMVYARDPKQPEIVLEAFDRPAGGAAAAAPPTVVSGAVRNWFPAVEVTLSVPRAYGYIIPAAHQAVVETLRAHGIVVRSFASDAPVQVEQYRVDAVKPAAEDYVAPESIAVTKKAVTVTVRRGDYYVSGAQAAANLIPNLLEPQAAFGLIRYRAFKLVPEQGALFPFLRLAKRQTLPLSPVK